MRLPQVRQEQERLRALLREREPVRVQQAPEPELPRPEPGRQQEQPKLESPRERASPEA